MDVKSQLAVPVREAPIRLQTSGLLFPIGGKPYVISITDLDLATNYDAKWPIKIPYSDGTLWAHVRKETKSFTRNTQAELMLKHVYPVAQIYGDMIWIATDKNWNVIGIPESTVTLAQKIYDETHQKTPFGGRSR